MRKWIHDRVIVTDLDNGKKTIYWTQADVAQALGVNPSAICRAIKLKRKIGGRFRVELEQ